MKGLITKALLAGCGIGALAAAVQAVEPTKCADPCWPERYSYMARQSVYAVSAPQIRNGHVLDQTVWNYFFEVGTDTIPVRARVAEGEALTRRPVRPSEEEAQRNPRSRSALLRAWRKAA